MWNWTPIVVKLAFGLQKSKHILARQMSLNLCVVDSKRRINILRVAFLVLFYAHIMFLHSFVYPNTQWKRVGNSVFLPLFSCCLLASLLYYQVVTQSEKVNMPIMQVCIVMCAWWHTQLDLRTTTPRYTYAQVTNVFYSVAKPDRIKWRRKHLEAI